MRLPRVFVVALMLLACAAGGSGASASRSSCSAEYSYAGYDDVARTHGVAATITPLAPAQVTWGHVAGWVGVGGLDLGPNHTTEWLQVGLIGWADEPQAGLYYEVTYPHRKAKLVELHRPVAVGEAHRVAVLELRRRRSWWRAWVDGVPVSKPIHLPGSHGAWHPQALSESWNGSTGACNAFAYKFGGVSVARRAGGSWRPMRRGYTYRSAGLSLSGRAVGFVATSL
jgi:hypothetical protein